MKTDKYRRWVLVNTFLVFFFTGILLAGPTPARGIDIIFFISAPFSLACFGTFLVDNLLSYFESYMGVKKGKFED